MTISEEDKSPHIISLFRFRMRELTHAQSEEYSNTTDRLMKIASAMPGFISFRDYRCQFHNCVRLKGSRT
jgi:heme-degrading monooxygenase HmoA